MGVLERKYVHSTRGTMDQDLNILIIETEKAIFAELEETLGILGFRDCNVSTPHVDIFQVKTLSPGLAILGPSLDQGAAQRCIHKLKIIDPVMPILVSSDSGQLRGRNSADVIDGIHYLSLKPGVNEIAERLTFALKCRNECKFRSDFTLLIGQSPEMRLIKEKILNVADKDITVLVTGETGTGKELIAQSIHYHSNRNDRPLVKINCGPLPDTLLESEVFGFQKGAFTDAYKSKPGRLELADGGTLFIDEIGDLSLSLQVKFLQVFEDKAFSRLGATRERIVDVRVVAATNSDLQEKVRNRTFRKDLYYRLNVAAIKVPPLRERKDDIPLLVHFFLNKYAFELNRALPEVPDEIMRHFLSYHWPGNVRELENVLRRALATWDWDFVFREISLREGGQAGDPSFIENVDKERTAPRDEKIAGLLSKSDFSLKEVTRAYVAEAEQEAILKALNRTQWNRKEAARLLGVSYKTLLGRIKEFQLEP